MRRVFVPIVCLLMSPPLFGQTSQSTSAPNRIQGNSPPTRPGSPRPPSFRRDAAKIAAELQLGEDQREAMQAILELMHEEASEQREARAKAIEIRADELTKARQEIALARRAGDRKRVLQLKEKIDEIRSAYASPDLYKILFERIGAILTDEQKARLPELKGKYPSRPEVKPLSLPNRQKVSALVRTLDLTDDQKEAVEAVEEAFTIRMTTAPIFDPDEYADFKLEFVNAIAALLRDEQRKKFEDGVGAAFFELAPPDRVSTMASRPRFMISIIKKLDLTVRQKEQVARIEKDFAERLANRKPRDLEVNRKLRLEIKTALARILTNEQSEKFEKAIEQKRAERIERRRAGEKAEKPTQDKPEKP